MHQRADFGANFRGSCNCIILDTATELGCGTGSIWVDHEDVIAKCSQIVLSDLSEGMLSTAKK